MNLIPTINFDCTKFCGDRPCEPNKIYAVFCDNCTFYEKDNSAPGAYPDIPPVDGGPDPEKVSKIVIVKLDAVGDVLRTTSVLTPLKKQYPNAEITWITKAKSFAVIKDNMLIDEIYFSEDELEHLYNDTFDIAVNLDSGQESCLIMSSLAADHKYGYTIAGSKPYPVNELALEWFLMGIDDNAKKANTKTYHKIIHEIAGLEYSGSKPLLPLTSLHRKLAGEMKKRFHLDGYEEMLLVNLGGGNRWQYKKWTRDGYIELVNMLSESSASRAIGIIAGGEDRDFYDEIAQAIEDRNNVIYFGCDNSVDEFIAISSMADKVFTADSLAFHIATALGKYTVVIVGPTSAAELDVFGNGKIITSTKVDCLACYLNKCDKEVTCMNTVSAEEIYQALVQ